MFNSFPKLKEFAITGYGGYFFENEVIQNNNNFNIIEEYDITDSVQVYYNVNKINKKIGLTKTCNIILNTNFNNNTNTFPIDDININAFEFSDDLNFSSIISIGKFKTIFIEFNNFINSILSYKEGFIHYNESIIDIHSNIMNEEYFYDNIKKHLYGNIQINKINEILDNSFFFENHYNIPKKYGFIDNDQIFIPYGLTYKLSYDIDISKLNNIGKRFVLNLKNESDMDNGCLLINTIIQKDKIIRTIKVPLLMKLIDKNTENILSCNIIPNLINKPVEEKIEELNTIITEPINDLHEEINIITEPMNTLDTISEPINDLPEEINIITEPINDLPEEINIITEPINDLPEEINIITEPINDLPEEINIITEPINTLDTISQPINTLDTNIENIIKPSIIIQQSNIILQSVSRTFTGNYSITKSMR